MNIYSVKQLNKADKVTIENQGITSAELMERAANLVFAEIDKRLNNAQIPIKIFCGIGNNGGDGLVVARLLLDKGYNVSVYVVNYSDKRSKDFLTNYSRLKDESKIWPTLLKEGTAFPELTPKDFVIDAIFGIGLNRPLLDWVGELVKYINASKAFVLSIDLPSGLYADKIPKKNSPIIEAAYTITFQSPKFSFFLPQTAIYVGDLQIIDIGLDRTYLQSEKSIAKLINKEDAIRLFIPRKKITHKGDYGHALVVGGSYGKIGSISLSGEAALRTGAGLCTIFSPKCGYQILQTLLPEAMVITDKDDDEITDVSFTITPSVICFGMGAGTSRATSLAFKSLLKSTKKPMVIDADGINILSENKDFLKLIPKHSILTPHPKELERLIGKWKDDIEKLEKAKEFSKEHQVILVLKDAYTITVMEDNLYINSSGNPGMATAGSGDVLSGVITGLISQNYNPLNAAVFGVYLHGLAGDEAAESLSYQGLISGDIINYLGSAYLNLFNGEV